MAFSRPAASETRPPLTRTVFEVGLAAASRRLLRQVGEAVEIETGVDTVDTYTAATTLSASYRLDPWQTVDALRAAYGEAPIPVTDLEPLARQLETQLGKYVETTDTDEVELAIIKPDGFDTVDVDGVRTRQAEISYPTDRSALVFGPEHMVGENPAGYGFHYVPYNFDSGPEADFYDKALRALNIHPDDVRDVYFTGAITDPKKTDLTFVYPRHGEAHRYTPDFVIHARGDRWLLVEGKMTARRADPVEGETGSKAKALRELVDANPGRIFYRMVFADTVAPTPDVTAVREFVDAEIAGDTAT